MMKCVFCDGEIDDSTWYQMVITNYAGKTYHIACWKEKCKR